MYCDKYFFRTNGPVPQGESMMSFMGYGKTPTYSQRLQITNFGIFFLEILWHQRDLELAATKINGT